MTNASNLLQNINVYYGENKDSDVNWSAAKDIKEATEQELLDKLASLESKIYSSGLLFSVVFFDTNIVAK